ELGLAKQARLGGGPLAAPSLTATPEKFTFVRPRALDWWILTRDGGQGRCRSHEVVVSYRIAPPTAPCPKDPLAGTPYRTLGPLGRGAMGEVVEAEHIALAKRVVVKILHLWLTHRRDLVGRMRLEGQALAHLSHPNIVAVTDLQITPEGRPYL